MFEQAVTEERNTIGDWALRGAIGLLFLMIGWEKFPENTTWPKLFAEIGWGQWFRYFTGVVEALGGLLVLIPWTVKLGAGLLAATMGSAALIMALVLKRPGDSVFSLMFCFGLCLFFWTRK